jgi:tyrosyl-tRNA synthetase
MTLLLEKAFAKASDLPRAVQQQLAEQILADIDGEAQWDTTLKNSQKLLEEMADKARRAKRLGKTVRKGFDEL